MTTATQRAVLGTVAITPTLAVSHAPLHGEPIPEGERLRVFDTPPAGHLLHIVTDDMMRPILRKGEIAVFDPEYHWPEEGRWFLKCSGCRTWSGGAIKRNYSIVETSRARNSDRWMMHPFYRSPNYKAIIAAGGIPRIIGFSDGPYRDDAVVADLLLGKLVGIYAPNGEIAS